MAGKKAPQQAKGEKGIVGAVHEEREAQGNPRHATEGINGCHWQTDGRGDQERNAAGERWAFADCGGSGGEGLRRARPREGRTLYRSERDYRRGRALRAGK